MEQGKQGKKEKKGTPSLPGTPIELTLFGSRIHRTFSVAARRSRGSPVKGAESPLLATLTGLTWLAAINRRDLGSFSERQPVTPSPVPELII